MRRCWSGVALALTAGLIVTGCDSGGGSGLGRELASEQILKLPLDVDVQSLDPAQLSDPEDTMIGQNVFGGLLKFDDHLKEVPDLAYLPEVSSDELTWTFHLRRDARFSNGDPVRARDIKYSWDRAATAAASQGPGPGSYAYFVPIQGFQDLAAGKATALTGTAAQDDLTFVLKLARRAGFLMGAITLPAFWIVDQKVVQQKGQDWWQTPDGLVGTGPFKMAGRVQNRSLDFEPVPNWWGGPTGALKKVHVEIVADLQVIEQKYSEGAFDVLGRGLNSENLDIAAGAHFMQSASQAKEVSVAPAAANFFVVFNSVTGPFAGTEGKPGRAAFSQAIDRQEVARDLARLLKTTPLAGLPATDGFIPPGLKGHLAANSDPYGKFDQAAAKRTYRQWDPGGTKVKGLKFTYPPSALNTPVAQELKTQWKSHLGVDVTLQPVDSGTFFDQLGRGAYSLSRLGLGAGFDSPSEWFDGFFAPDPTGSRSMWYGNETVAALLAKADQQLLDKALPDYLIAAKSLVDDVAVAPFLYAISVHVVKPYVLGAGGNALSDYYWTGIKILKH